MGEDQRPRRDQLQMGLLLLLLLLLPLNGRMALEFGMRAGSRCKCKYLQRGVTERSYPLRYVSTDEIIPGLGGESPFFQAGENWDIN